MSASSAWTLCLTVISSFSLSCLFTTLTFFEPRKKISIFLALWIWLLNDDIETTGIVGKYAKSYIRINPRNFYENLHPGSISKSTKTLKTGRFSCFSRISSSSWISLESRFLIKSVSSIDVFSSNGEIWSRRFTSFTSSFRDFFKA